MVNLTMPKTGTAIPVPPAGPLLTDVIADIERRETTGEISKSTADSYRAAIRTLARKLNRPVETCPVDLDQFDRLYPLDGFDPDWNRTEQGYLTWRNRARTSLENFLGIAATKKALRDVEDGWSDLLAVLKPYTKGHPTRWVIAPQKLIALKSFAQTCRAHDRQPWQVDLAFMQELESLYQGNRRTSHRTAARRMDEYRKIPEALPLLPPQPIGFTREHQHAPLVIPAAFAAEFEPWVIAATEKDWGLYT